MNCRPGEVGQLGLNLYWRTLAKARGMRLCATDVEWTVSDDGAGPERVFRVQIERTDAEARVSELVEMIISGRLPGELLLSPTSTPANITQLLAESGFRLNHGTPYMYKHLDRVSSRLSAPAGVRLGRVCDQWALSDWVNLTNAEAEILGPEQFSDLFSLDETQFYLAYSGDRAASACMTIAEGDLATLEMVYTEPTFRGRGIAGALIQEALDQLFLQGVQVVTLRAAPLAVGLYQRLGFQRCGERVLAVYSQRKGG